MSSMLLLLPHVHFLSNETDQQSEFFHITLLQTHRRLLDPLLRNSAEGNISIAFFAASLVVPRIISKTLWVSSSIRTVHPVDLSSLRRLMSSIAKTLTSFRVIFDSICLADSTFKYLAIESLLTKAPSLFSASSAGLHPLSNARSTQHFLKRIVFRAVSSANSSNRSTKRVCGQLGFSQKYLFLRTT